MHTPSKEEWEAFKSKLFGDFTRSGEVEGFDEVKGNMDLQWIDGKEVGLPHDDVEAAKRQVSYWKAYKLDLCFHSLFGPFSASIQMRRRA